MAMADGGERPIAELVEGDMVASWDARLMKPCAQAVVAVCAHRGHPVCRIVCVDGHCVTCTAGHRLFVPGKGWAAW